MREKEIVQTVTIKHQAVGTEATKAAVNSVTDAVKGLGDAAQTTGAKQEQATRRQASAAAAFEQLERRVNPAARALADYERAQRLVGRAVDQNAALQDRGNAILQTYRDRVAAAGAAHGELGKGAGLARHELVNLSRQAQDVAVSLGSGQGFGTVLLQQGTQIMDILGTSQGGIRGALSSLGGVLRNIFTVGRVAFGGLAASIAGATFALSDYLGKQRDAERSLIGAGRRSGATAADVNQIGSAAASPTGFSVSEARAVALEFAKTGDIHKSVITGMIETTRNFAIITEQSGQEAAQALAKSFSSMQGVDALNERFNFLDATTRRTIESLYLYGRTTEAAALASQKLNEVIAGAGSTLSASEKGWTALTNAISNGWTAIGEFLARAADLEKLNIGDQIAKVQAQIAQVQAEGPGMLGIASQEEKLARLGRQLDELTAKKLKFDNSADFNKLSNSAAQAVSAMDPLRAKLDEAVAKIAALRAAPEGSVAGLQMALTYWTQIADQIQRQSVAQEALLAKYPGMTLEFAKQVEALEQQNRLLKARESGNEASVSAAIEYERAIARGANETEAAAVKALTLKNNLLQAASAASNLSVQLDFSESDAYDAAGGHRPDTVSSGDYSYLSNNTFGGKQYSFMSDFEFALRQTAGRLASAQDIINGSLAGGVSGALASLKGTNLSSTFRNPFGSPIDINAIRPGYGSQSDITSATGQLFDLKLAQAGDDNAAKQAIYADQLAWLQQQPGTIQNLQQQAAIMQAMKNLTDAVNDNTAAQNASLNPLYDGRSALKIGYYKAATGLEGIVGGSGGVDSTPVNLMLTPGEHLKVTPPGQSTNDNSKTIINNVTNIFGGSQSKTRRSMRQASQGFAQMMAANS